MTHTAKGATRRPGRGKQTAESKPASGQLQAALQQLAGTFTDRAVSSISGRLSGATERLTDYAQNGGGSGLLSAVTGVDDLTSPVKTAVKAGLSSAGGKVTDTVKNAAGSLFGGKGKGGKKSKITNIVEHIDVGAPVDLVYDQWTQFADFPKYMKKLEQVEQKSDEKLRWKAQVFWSHRSWESTITEQVPNERIVWRSKGDKGYLDGAVTFHELARNLTRVVVVLEYHPQGFFEKTGNIWRAQGRRIRLELKNFQREVMMHAVLHPDEVEGWHGEIRDGEVVDDGRRDEDGQTRAASRPKQQRATDQSRTSKRTSTGRASGATSSGRRRVAAKGGRRA
ncbi:SRPBCC family protein [Mycobacterium colombiense]|uniref:SRPBCC family protein n=1 Tax=Mycobacterium colombiense TaxID=339268 RepID=UPI0009BDBCFA|nr:SRPBCC family protein [Mycobacterium colombiense]